MQSEKAENCDAGEIVLRSRAGEIILCILKKYGQKISHSLAQFKEETEKAAMHSAADTDHRGHVTACGLCPVLTWALFSQMLTRRRMKRYYP